MDPWRIQFDHTAEELRRNLQSLFCGTAAHGVGAPERKKIWEEGSADGDIVVDQGGKDLIAFIVGNKRKPTHAVRLTFYNGCGPNERRIAKTFVRLFNGDIASAPRLGRDSDTWISLQQTRFSRTIARLTSFPTDFFLRCIRMIEAAREITYEGSPFATRLLLTKQLSHIGDAAGSSFLQLPQYLPLGTAILGEKWTRALTLGGSVALVATPHQSMVAGVLALPETNSPNTAGLHGSLSYLASMVQGGVILIAATANGDLYVMLAGGMTFLKRQGRWQYFDVTTLSRHLKQHVADNVADALLRQVIDASFERHGALFGIIPDGADVHEIVPDSGRTGRANRGLRDLAKKLSLCEPSHQPLIKSASQVDGAVLINPAGEVLDAACMVAEPSLALRGQLGIVKWPSYPGARSTAARNCSIYGLAIKVSEDGPISLFENGRLRWEMG